ncbi:hypothetical protein P154DRAFT_517610, partial [Amniculicola lignicola CBS 123094]
MYDYCARNSTGIAPCICMVSDVGAEAALLCAKSSCRKDSSNCEKRWIMEWTNYCLRELPELYTTLEAPVTESLPACTATSMPMTATITPVTATTTATTKAIISPTPTAAAAANRATLGLPSGLLLYILWIF